MFFCNECAIENDWTNGIMKSSGKCEVCKKHAICWDVPSKYLKPVKRDEAQELNKSNLDKSIDRNREMCDKMMAAHKSSSQHDVNYLLGLELKEEDADKVANCFYLYQKEITDLKKELESVKQELAEEIHGEGI